MHAIIVDIYYLHKSPFSKLSKEAKEIAFYPRVYVVYRRVYILLCSCSCCFWEAFNQTCQYFGRQLVKHDHI
jgi:hypothetical protein